MYWTALGLKVLCCLSNLSLVWFRAFLVAMKLQWCNIGHCDVLADAVCLWLWHHNVHQWQWIQSSIVTSMPCLASSWDRHTWNLMRLRESIGFRGFWGIKGNGLWLLVDCSWPSLLPLSWRLLSCLTVFYSARYFAFCSDRDRTDVRCCLRKCVFRH